MLARSGLQGPKVLREKVSDEPCDSPAVLRPLVMAIKQSCTVRVLRQQFALVECHWVSPVCSG
jgi:hypothetical protein